MKIHKLKFQKYKQIPEIKSKKNLKIKTDKTQHNLFNASALLYIRIFLLCQEKQGVYITIHGISLTIIYCRSFTDECH